MQSNKKYTKEKPDIENSPLEIFFIDDSDDALDQDIPDTINTNFILLKSIIVLIFSIVITCIIVTRGICRNTTTPNTAASTKAPISTNETEQALLLEQYTINYLSSTTPHLSCYAYNSLSSDMQHLYVEIYEAIAGFKECATLSTLSEVSVAQAYACVLADHGELFWINGYTIRSYLQGDALIRLDFVPMYTMTQPAANTYKKNIDAAVADIIANAPREGNSYDKLKYVYDYLATNVTYNIDADENQNILSVFLYKETVCQGYAASMQYLLKELGIQSTIVSGTYDNLPHAWNLVRLDGDYYYVDVTLARTSLKNSGDYFIDYSYFAVTTSEMEKNHVAGDTFILPNCQEQKYNYFMEESKFFDEFDAESIGKLCKEALQSHTPVVSIKFSSLELLKQTREYFINAGHLYEYCGMDCKPYYIENDNSCILTIGFE